MPNARSNCWSVLLALTLAGATVTGAQQVDSIAVRDSIARSDSARADSLRRRELHRIRGEPRAMTPPDVGPGPGRRDREMGRRESIGLAASVAGDMITDLSPRAASRSDGSRIRLRDIEGALAGSYGPRVRGILAMTFTDDGLQQRLVATDAAAILGAARGATRAEFVVGRAALPFGQVARLHRHELTFPDQPLPVRVLLGSEGLRGTGAQLLATRTFSRARMSVELAVADRFGARADSLHPGEPPDQSLAGIAAGGRLGTQFGAIGARWNVGVSSISGKREQPIGCVYEGTVGPVPCPEAVTAANTRLTVLGADARLAWGRAGERFGIDGEWLRMVVGATDLPVFSNARFAAFYRGLTGTYDGGYVRAHAAVARGLIVGAQGEWLQNPEVGGMNDLWAGGYLGAAPFRGARVTASYQRRIPSTAALAAMSPDERLARDRIVLRGTLVVGRHPRTGRD